jgi:DNA-binding CsgD family transcriptional regulator
VNELAQGRQVDAAEIAALTRREREIALALAGGLSNKEIAERFCISLPTVKSHVHCILRKLSIDRRDEVLSRLRGVVPRSKADPFSIPSVDDRAGPSPYDPCDPKRGIAEVNMASRRIEKGGVRAAGWCQPCLSSYASLSGRLDTRNDPGAPQAAGRRIIRR